MRKRYHERFAARRAVLEQLSRSPVFAWSIAPTDAEPRSVLAPAVSVAMNQTVDYTQLPLRDIHLPGAIGWWPPAPGWWLLAALVFAGLALYGVHYYRGRHKRTALRAVTRVHAALEQGAEPVACLQHVSTILRRFAMTSESTAARHGRRRGSSTCPA